MKKIVAAVAASTFLALGAVAVAPTEANATSWGCGGRC